MLLDQNYEYEKWDCMDGREMEYDNSTLTISLFIS